MEFDEVLARRASCREFSADPVSREVILEVLRAGARAPSPMNQQPWQFVVILGEEARATVYEIACDTRDAAFQETGKAWVGRYDLNFLKDAPVLIVVVADSTSVGLSDFLGERQAHLKAASACVENILLAAVNRGLGCVWFTLYDSAALRRALQIETAFDIVGVLPLGYPKADPRPSQRCGVEEKIRYIE